jgi:hypothetical protein
MIRPEIQFLYNSGLALEVKMKKSLFVVLLLLAILALGISSAGAQAFTYTSGFQVQNLASSQATLVITFVNQDGSTEATLTAQTIPANGSQTYFPLSAVPDGFNGSVVISSDEPVAAITNVVGDNFSAAAAYEAVSEGSTTVLLPLLMQNNSGFSTWFNVQNTGSAAASVNVAYSDGSSAGPVTIQPGASQTFIQTAETHTQAVFSGVITSDQPVAASVIEESSAVMFAYSGFNAGSTDPVMPLINANNSGYITGIQIQNAGASATDVTVSYTPSLAGTACTETQTVPANSSATFALFAFANGANSTCAAGATFVGSAQVTGNSTSQELVAITNQLLPNVNGEAYSGFDPAAATDTSVMPLIMDRNSGYFTGFNVQNVGSSSTDVTCTFSGGVSYTVNATLAAGAATTALQNGQIADGYVGSGTCTSTGEPILAIVNELGPSGTADQLLVYNGIVP